MKNWFKALAALSLFSGLIALAGCPLDEGSFATFNGVVSMANVMDGVTVTVSAGPTTDAPDLLGSGVATCDSRPFTATTGSASGTLFLKILDSATGATLATPNIVWDPVTFLIISGTPAMTSISSIGLTRSDKPTLHLVHNEHSMITGVLDFYVTAPGANISALTPDASGVAYSQHQGKDSWVHVGADFQVRACVNGTKTVIADSGPIPSAAASRHYVFSVHRQAGTTQMCIWSMMMP